MTLPASGAFSANQVNIEIAVSSTATISANDAAVRSLAGVASGAISATDLHGKSYITYTPAAGSYSNTVTSGFSTFNITCSQTATWTWSRTGSASATASIASGGTGTLMTLSLASGGVGTLTQSIFTISATASGVTAGYTIDLICDRT